MLRTIRFFKINDGPQTGWYADLPNNTLEDNEMMAGSDTFLEEIDRMTDCLGEVHITCSDNNETGDYICKLIQKEHDQDGATYIITGNLAEKYGAVGFTCWLCNVTHQVFGEHPLSIYIHSIS